MLTEELIQYQDDFFLRKCNKYLIQIIEYHAPTLFTSIRFMKIVRQQSPLLVASYLYIYE